MDDSRVENLEDDDMFVVNYEVSPARIVIVMTSRNKPKNLNCEDLALFIDSTCKKRFNGCQAHALERVDK